MNGIRQAYTYKMPLIDTERGTTLDYELTTFWSPEKVTPETTPATLEVCAAAEAAYWSKRPLAPAGEAVLAA